MRLLRFEQVVLLYLMMLHPAKSFILRTTPAVYCGGRLAACSKIAAVRFQRKLLVPALSTAAACGNSKAETAENTVYVRTQATTCIIATRHPGCNVVQLKVDPHLRAISVFLLWC